VRHLLDHRDFTARDRADVPVIAEAALARMRMRLADRRRFDESDALTLLGDAGLPANAGTIVEGEAPAIAAAEALGYPVVLKTAKRGLDHKSDQQGIHLSLTDKMAVSTAYRDLAKRIDTRVLVAPMVEAHGVEMLLGMVHDAQFGPVVLIGAGGVHVEALADAVYAVPPFGPAEAARLLQKLRIAPLLASRRHRRPLAVDEFCRVAARFSALAAALGDQLSEIDLNPVIVHADGCAIVDALVVPRAAEAPEPELKRQAR
jgi:succinyl-CoA synthetase beta subunit